jgi:hypothetical protein
VAIRPGRVVEIAALLSKMCGALYTSSNPPAAVRVEGGLTRIRAGGDPATIIVSTWAAGETRWRLMRNRYLLYR